MPKYLFSVSYSSEGMKGVAKEGGSKRREAADQLIKSVGGKMESFYFAFGAADAYVIADFPDQASAVAAVTLVNSSGTTTLNTTVLLTPEEIDQAVKKNPQYRPPGK
jgi:uncharacterized protein with GYD domain